MSADLQAVPTYKKFSPVNNNVANSSTTSKNTLPNESVSSNTDISVIARINYNLRFTKQAVFVLGQNTEQYSLLATEFLGNLSTNPSKAQANKLSEIQLNVAFVSASNKLDDIQIRCRLIEQLFVNTLFDPEQSLAVSIFNLASEKKQSISIVIDHAHSLSLQVKYELCQLVTIAKKNNLAINLVMFGLTSAGHKIATNKSLFKNKITLIDALTGQVISLNNNKILANNHIGIFTRKQKQVFIGVISTLVVVLVCLYLFIIGDIQNIDFGNEDPTLHNNNEKPTLETKQVINKHRSSTSTVGQSEHIKIETDVVLNKESLATNEDIHQALLNQYLPIEKIIPANTGDILQALAQVDEQIVKASVSLSKSIVVSDKKHENNKQYYLQSFKQLPQGYLVQIAAFNDMKSTVNFIALHKQQTLYWYKKEVKGRTYIIVTSPIFKSVESANTELSSMAESLLLRKPWIRSISSIINEINTFN
jgi:DamX protein